MTRKTQLRNFSFDYDPENDSLYLYDPKNKGNASIEFDNLVVDFTSKGKISGIEILDASNFFPKILTSEFSMTKEELEGLTACKVEFDYQTNMIFFKLLLAFKTQQLVANLAAPMVTEPSPALLTAA